MLYLYCLCASRSTHIFFPCVLLSQTPRSEVQSKTGRKQQTSIQSILVFSIDFFISINEQNPSVSYLYIFILKMKRFIKKRELRKTFNRLQDEDDKQDDLHKNDPRMKLDSPTHRWKDKSSERESSYSTMMSTRSSNSNAQVDTPTILFVEQQAVPTARGGNLSAQGASCTPAPSTPCSRSDARLSNKKNFMKSSPKFDKVPKPWPVGIPRLSEGLSPPEFQDVARLSFCSSASSSCGDSEIVQDQSPTLSSWQVQDDRLKPIPPLHPPIHPCCMVYVGDNSATPSIIAYRISECLRKRSIVVEYDSETTTPTATCLNQEGVMFVIYLYRGGKGSMGTSVGSNHALDSGVNDSFDSQTLTYNKKKYEKIDFSHGIIVECMRIRGDVISFHRDCRAILSCARGDSDGLDDLRSSKVALLHSSLGFGCQKSRARHAVGAIVQIQDNVELLDVDEIPNNVLHGFKRNRFVSQSQNEYNNATKATFQALTHAFRNIEKDRLDCRLLGMESLVMLTDVRCCGVERAYLASLTVLGSCTSNKRWLQGPFASKRDDDSYGSHHISRIHERVMAFAKGNGMSLSSSQRTTSPTHLLAESDHRGHDNNYEHDELDDHETNNDIQQECAITKEYNVHLRRNALHILANAFDNIIRYCDDFPLLPRPSCDDVTTVEFLERLGEDLSGATRPPMTTLGSAHESCYAAKILRLLSMYSNRGYTLVNEGVVGDPSRSINDLLDRARMTGSVCHRSLELEAQLAQSAIEGYDLDLSAAA